MGKKINLIFSCLYFNNWEDTNQSRNLTVSFSWIIFGVSNNDSVLIDNKYAKHIGYIPRDNGEDYRVKVETKDGFVDSNDPLVKTHGGYFASAGHFDDS